MLAEKARESVAGIILMFPSTCVLGFLFLGITTSGAQVAEAVPSTLGTFGIVILSSVVYINFAKGYEKLQVQKGLKILLSFFSASVVWFVLAFPFAFFKVKNIWLGLGIYAVLGFLAHLILKKASSGKSPKRMIYAPRQTLFRAFFIGAVIMLVVLAGKLLDPFWGAMFVMYPAATLSSLVILHYYYEPEVLFYFFKQAPLGSLSVVLYCLVVMFFYPGLGIVWGTLLGLFVCVLFSALLIGLQRKKTV